MPTEIERTFLVADDTWRDEVRDTSAIEQGYLHVDATTSIRVRIRDGRGVLTVKRGGPGRVREEVEVSLAPGAARDLLDDATVGDRIHKQRHLVDLDAGLVAEVDEFAAAHAGLVLVEVELPTGDVDPAFPAWFGDEVTDDERYYNARLARHGVPGE